MVKFVYGGGPLFPGQPFGTAIEINKLIDILLANGIQTIDTAQIYGNGQAETLLGEAGAAARLNIDTKHCGGWIPGESSAETVIARAKESLKKLKTTKVDIFYLHAPDRDTALKDTLSGIDKLYKAGAFKRFGISNFTADEVEEIIAVAKANSFILPSVFQGHYSPVGRKQENKLFPILRKHGISFYAYSPQAGGFLAKTKSQLMDSNIEGRWDVKGPAGQLFRSLYSRPALLEALDTWDQISKESGIPRAELAYRWVAFNSMLDDKFGDAMIFSASSFDQLEQSLAGLKRGPLPADVTRRIDKIWELVKDVSPLDHFNKTL
ncbi:NADP-dependent oxidoreductase domain-containing protein [Xylogone sp. PMI_703]|nr:NADP-dependent oxidoreductase domain-containing protein [Xylogone sp. PMI_703]